MNVDGVSSGHHRVDGSPSLREPSCWAGVGKVAAFFFFKVKLYVSIDIFEYQMKKTSVG